jgi:hypothetical protein
MKKILLLLVLTTSFIFADESVLIDFSKLEASRTSMVYTVEGQEELEVSLELGDNWFVELNRSSRTTSNDARSYVKAAPSKQYKTVLGARVHFPDWPHNSSVLIRPPFEIPAYEPLNEGDNGYASVTKFEDGYGVVKNVGVLKSIAVNVYGLNFPYLLNIVLIDPSGQRIIRPMGYLNFEGWGELRWDNPSYVSEVRNRDLHIQPLYPDSTPFVKFGGFEIQRDGSSIGGDFIVYFKDVKIIYDKASLETDRDIDDEAIWGIISQRENEKKSLEMKSFGLRQRLMNIEREKQATETDFSK